MRVLCQLVVVAVILSGMFGDAGVDRTEELREELFSSSEPGWIFNPNKLSSLFQDAAMTLPVTAVDQPVGAMTDLSGNGNHAKQATATARPVLKRDAAGRYFLQSDGVDDFLLFSLVQQDPGVGRIVSARVKHNQGSTRVVIGTSSLGNYLGQVSGVHQWRGAGVISSDVPGSTLASVVGYYGPDGGGLIVNDKEFPALTDSGVALNSTLFGDADGVARLAGVDFYGGVLRTGNSSRAQALLVRAWLDKAR